MNHAKKVTNAASGYPKGVVKPLTKYPLRNLRKGQRREYERDPGESTFDARSPAALAFEERLMGVTETVVFGGTEHAVEPTILEDFTSNVLPPLARAVTGLRAHGDAFRTVLSNTARFASSSALTVFAAARGFVMRTVERRV